MTAASLAVALMVSAPAGYDARRSLQVLAATGATDAADQIAGDGAALTRAVLLDDVPYLLHIRPSEDATMPGFVLSIRAADGAAVAPDSAAVTAATAWVTRRFALDVDMDAVAVALGTDVYGAMLRDRCWPTRPPGLADAWSCLLKTLIGNRIYRPLAMILQRGLMAEYGPVAHFDGIAYPLFPEVGRVAMIPPEELIALRFSRQKANALPALAARMMDDPVRFDWDRLRALPGAEAIAILDELPGVGPWTAGYVALRGLRHPDVFVADDGLRQSVAVHMELPPDIPAVAFTNAIARYAPYRSYACHYSYMVLYGGAGSGSSDNDGGDPVAVK